MGVVYYRHLAQLAKLCVNPPSALWRRHRKFPVHIRNLEHDSSIKYTVRRVVRRGYEKDWHFFPALWTDDESVDESCSKFQFKLPAKYKTVRSFPRLSFRLS